MLEGWGAVFATMSCDVDAAGSGEAAAAAGPKSCCSMDMLLAVSVVVNSCM